MEQIFLSRRNLQTLLNKLNRKADGGSTHCTLIKNDKSNAKYPQSIGPVMVTAVEDDDYYADREAGPVNELDEPR